MAYTKVFERPYSGGWVNYPSETTLITADALNEYDETFQHVEDYLEDNPIADANAAITNDYWNNSTTYAVGDIVIYLNGLYRCKVANTGQTPTATAYWEAISLTDIAQPKLIANTDFITMETGFTLLNTQIYKQGYRVFGDICVKKSTAYGSTTVTAGTIKSGYLPKVGILPMCMLGTDEWAQQGVGYCYIGTSGSLLFGDQNNTGNKKAAKVHIDYMTA